MAGHSKWANIKHRKGAVDAKRGKIFTKLIKEITVAARLGGNSTDTNARLRLAVDKAKSQSLPKDKIERAIQKGTGELEGENIEEVIYEGYGPGGVALLLNCTTDNKTRTVAEIRNVFTKKGGHLGESGSVAWVFEKKGLLRVEKKSTSEETLLEKALEAGAEDLMQEQDTVVITTSFEDYFSVREKLEKTGVAFLENSGIEMISKNNMTIENEEDAKKLFSLIETLEDLDDVQTVWANFDIPEDLIEKVNS